MATISWNSRFLAARYLRMNFSVEAERKMIPRSLRFSNTSRITASMLLSRRWISNCSGASFWK